MNGNKKIPNCSIKGCNYKAKWSTHSETTSRLYCICPAHKFLIINPLKWVKVEK